MYLKKSNVLVVTFVNEIDGSFAKLVLVRQVLFMAAREFGPLAEVDAGKHSTFARDARVSAKHNVRFSW